MVAALAAVTSAAITVAISITPREVLPVVVVIVPAPWLHIVVAGVYSAKPMGSGVSGVTCLAAGCRIPSLLRQGMLLMIQILIGGDRALPIALVLRRI